jgi:hypothetical protein
MDFLIVELGENNSIHEDMLIGFEAWLENELKELEARNSTGNFERGMIFELKTLLSEVKIVRGFAESGIITPKSYFNSEKMKNEQS